MTLLPFQPVFAGGSTMRRIVMSLAVLLTVWLLAADSALARCKRSCCCDTPCCQQASCTTCTQGCNTCTQGCDSCCHRKCKSCCATTCSTCSTCSTCGTCGHSDCGCHWSAPEQKPMKAPAAAGGTCARTHHLGLRHEGREPRPFSWHSGSQCATVGRRACSDREFARLLHLRCGGTLLVYCPPRTYDALTTGGRRMRHDQPG